MKRMLFVAMFLILFSYSLKGQQATLSPSSLLGTNAISRFSTRVQVMPESKPLLRANQVLIPLDFGKTALDSHDVLVSSGTTRQLASEALEVSAGQTNLVVQANQQLILRPHTGVETKSLKSGQVEFPGLMVCAWSGGADKPLQALQGRLFLRPREAPLPWDGQSQSYATKLVVGLDLENHTGSIQLNPPVTVEFFPANAQVQPTRIDIQRTGTSGYQETDLSCLRHEDAVVTARSDMGELSCPVEVVARLGGLSISASSKRLAGLGLGTTELLCERQAEDGTALRSPEELEVRLAATQGELESTLVIPPGASSATTELRTAGLGKVSVSASADGIDSEAELEFIFPFGLMLATVIGGCIGGIAHSFQKNVRSRKRRVRMTIEGVIVGLVAVAAVTAGMVIGNLPLPALGTELGAFLVAALGGYMGTRLLDQMVEKVFPGTQKG